MLTYDNSLYPRESREAERAMIGENRQLVTNEPVEFER